MSSDKRKCSIPLSEINCADCSIGNRVEFGSAQFCPFIVRNHPTGAVLGKLGEASDYIWFISSGAVAGTAGAGREANVLFPPGSFVGLETLHQPWRALTVWTLARTSTCGITPEGFLRWLEGQGALRDELMKESAEVLAAAEQRRKDNSTFRYSPRTHPK